MKILLIGHACGPDLGSEPGFTWNWAWHLSATDEVWVLTHPERRAEVESYLERHPRPKLHFEWAVPQTPFDPWKPGHGERGIKVHYLLWLATAYGKARQLHSQVRFDVAHHVSWGTIGAAPSLWKLAVPCVWGPVGGAQATPKAFLTYYRRPWAERLRSLYVQGLRFSPRLRKAARSARLILTTNRETSTFLESLGARNVRPMLDGGLPAEFVSQQCPSRTESVVLRLLWAGRLEPRKGLELVLRALAKTPAKNVALTVAGTGPLRAAMEELCTQLGIQQQVTFLGAVPYPDMPALFRSCDAFVFSSLRDSFGSVVLEAMAQGLAIVMLDHQGVGTFVPDEAAFKVPVTNPSETAAALATSIAECAQAHTYLRTKQLAAWNFAQQQTWIKRAEQMRTMYGQILGVQNDESPAVPREMVIQ